MRKINLFLVLTILTMACRKPYNPPVVSSPGSFLVVEGVINSGSDSTIIKLSTTTAISVNALPNPVLNATVSVESDQKNSYPLSEAGNGKYTANGLNLDATRNYRLDIQTADGQKYQSDFEPVINTPPIDSIGFTIQNADVQLYLNTHDPNNKLNYYRWDYKETWQFHSLYESKYVTDGKEIVFRTAAQDIYTCFSNDTSSTILLGSTAKLKEAVIDQMPLTQIASTSEKIEAKYSILVNQYALTGDAYNFWTNLKKNTEQLGSIFDAEPSGINGNIHCITNPSAPVIGYISVCKVQQKRIFISNSQVPLLWSVNRPYPYNCIQDTALFCRPEGSSCQNDVALFLIPPGSEQIPITQLNVNGLVLGYLDAGVECTDCTIRGTKVQPPFWK